MLTKTFCHIKGISTNSEKLLWENGINHWNDFLEKESRLDCLSKNKLASIKCELPISMKALEQKNLKYFQSMLNPKEHWRLFNFGKTAYVDIETTGISRWSDDITVIGIYDGTTSHLYVKDKNLLDAKAKLQEFDTIVTFNGKQFDLPFIEYKFSCKYDFIHLDLRYMLKEIGLQGGLKSIERQLGILRDTDVKDIDGFEAVRLWYKYCRGNQNALQTLLKYNEQDIVNLKTLLTYYLKKKQEQMLDTPAPKHMR